MRLLNKLVNRLFFRKKRFLNYSGGIVSICFDDFHPSCASIGKKILDAYGIKGTYYYSFGCMKKNSGDHSSFDIIKNLSFEGHEIGCHTKNHKSFKEMNESEIIQDLNENKKIIESVIGANKLKSFAYPFGDTTVVGKKILDQRFECSRTTQRGINSGWVDLNLVKANSLYERNFNLSFLEKVLDQNRKENGWLIFYTHDIEENASQFGITPHSFNECIKVIKKSAGKILPVQEALNILRNKSEILN